MSNYHTNTSPEPLVSRTNASPNLGNHQYFINTSQQSGPSRVRTGHTPSPSPKLIKHRVEDLEDTVSSVKLWTRDDDYKTLQNIYEKWHTIVHDIQDHNLHFLRMAKDKLDKNPSNSLHVQCYEANKENLKNFRRCQEQYEEQMENGADIQLIFEIFDIAREEIENYRFNPEICNRQYEDLSRTPGKQSIRNVRSEPSLTPETPINTDSHAEWIFLQENVNKIEDAIQSKLNFYLQNGDTANILSVQRKLDELKEWLKRAREIQNNMATYDLESIEDTVFNLIEDCYGKFYPEPESVSHNFTRKAHMNRTPVEQSIRNVIRSITPKTPRNNGGDIHNEWNFWLHHVNLIKNQIQSRLNSNLQEGGNIRSVRKRLHDFQKWLNIANKKIQNAMATSNLELINEIIFNLLEECIEKFDIEPESVSHIHVSHPQPVVIQKNLEEDMQNIQKSLRNEYIDRTPVEQPIRFVIGSITSETPRSNDRDIHSEWNFWLHRVNLIKGQIQSRLNSNLQQGVNIRSVRKRLHDFQKWSNEANKKIQSAMDTSNLESVKEIIFNFLEECNEEFDIEAENVAHISMPHYQPVVGQRNVEEAFKNAQSGVVIPGNREQRTHKFKKAYEAAIKSSKAVGAVGRLMRELGVQEQFGALHSSRNPTVAGSSQNLSSRLGNLLADARSAKAKKSATDANAVLDQVKEIRSTHANNENRPISPTQVSPRPTTSHRSIPATNVRNSGMPISITSARPAISTTTRPGTSNRVITTTRVRSATAARATPASSAREIFTTKVRSATAARAMPATSVKAKSATSTRITPAAVSVGPSEILIKQRERLDQRLASRGIVPITRSIAPPLMQQEYDNMKQRMEERQLKLQQKRSELQQARASQTFLPKKLTSKERRAVTEKKSKFDRENQVNLKAAHAIGTIKKIMKDLKIPEHYVQAAASSRIAIDIDAVPIPSRITSQLNLGPLMGKLLAAAQLAKVTKSDQDIDNVLSKVEQVASLVATVIERERPRSTRRQVPQTQTRQLPQSTSIRSRSVPSTRSESRSAMNVRQRIATTSRTSQEDARRVARRLEPTEPHVRRGQQVRPALQNKDTTEGTRSRRDIVQRAPQTGPARQPSASQMRRPQSVVSKRHVQRGLENARIASERRLAHSHNQGSIVPETAPTRSRTDIVQRIPQTGPARQPSASQMRRSQSVASQRNLGSAVDPASARSRINTAQQVPQTEQIRRPSASQMRRPQSGVIQRNAERVSENARRIRKRRLAYAQNYDRPAPVPAPVRSRRDMTQQERDAWDERKRILNEQIKIKKEIGTQKKAKHEEAARTAQQFGASARTIKLPETEITEALVSQADLERIRSINLNKLDKRRTVGQVKRELFDMPEYRRDLQTKGVKLPPSKIPPPESRIQQVAPTETHGTNHQAVTTEPRPGPSSRSVSPTPGPSRTEHTTLTPSQSPARTTEQSRTAAKRIYEEQMRQRKKTVAENLLSQAYGVKNSNELDQFRGKIEFENIINRNRVARHKANLRSRQAPIRRNHVSRIRLANNVNEEQQRTIAHLYKLWRKSVHDALKMNKDAKLTLLGHKSKSQCSQKHNELKVQIADLQNKINDVKNTQDVELLESTVFDAIEIIFQDRYICSERGENAAPADTIQAENLSLYYANLLDANNAKAAELHNALFENVDGEEQSEISFAVQSRDAERSVGLRNDAQQTNYERRAGQRHAIQRSGDPKIGSQRNVGQRRAGRISPLERQLHEQYLDVHVSSSTLYSLEEDSNLEISTSPQGAAALSLLIEREHRRQQNKRNQYVATTNRDMPILPSSEKYRSSHITPTSLQQRPTLSQQRSKSSQQRSTSSQRTPISSQQTPTFTQQSLTSSQQIPTALQPKRQREPLGSNRKQFLDLKKQIALEHQEVQNRRQEKLRQIRLRNTYPLEKETGYIFPTEAQIADYKNRHEQNNESFDHSFSYHELQEKFPQETQHERHPPYEPAKTPEWYRSPNNPNYAIDADLMEGLVWQQAEESDTSSTLSFKIAMMLKYSAKKSQFIAGQRRLLQFDEEKRKQLVSLTFKRFESENVQVQLQQSERAVSMQNDAIASQEASEVSRLLDLREHRTNTSTREIANALLPFEEDNVNVVSAQGNSIIPTEVPQTNVYDIDEVARENAELTLRAAGASVPQENLATQMLNEDDMALNENLVNLSTINVHRVNVGLQSVAPKYENFVQLRGSAQPNWFPGFYTVFPGGENDSFPLEQKTPSKTIQNAWISMKPTRI